jgi:hypothetical protein
MHYVGFDHSNAGQTVVTDWIADEVNPCYHKRESAGSDDPERVAIWRKLSKSGQCHLRSYDLMPLETCPELWSKATLVLIFAVIQFYTNV